MRIPYLDLIASLAERITEVLNPLIPVGSKCALVDFPNYGNVGDSAIWLGEKIFLKNRAAELVYASDRSAYQRDKLERRIRGGAILIQGGGNLGDLWLPHQLFRERIIADFPDTKIIQLPQTIHFKQKDNLDRARAIFNGHPDLTLLVRDEESLNIARNEFRAQSFLCPDMAFMLGELRRPEEPRHKIVWLSRTDLESLVHEGSYSEREVHRTDWVRDPPSLVFRANNFIHYHAQRRTPLLGSFAEPIAYAYDALARQRLRRGCWTLGAGKVVVTDRLHGHILCLLLGIPHVLLDNSYGKVKNFYRIWTRDCGLTTWAVSLEDALQVARSLVKASENSMELMKAKS